MAAQKPRQKRGTGSSFFVLFSFFDPCLSSSTIVVLLLPLPKNPTTMNRSRRKRPPSPRSPARLPNNAHDHHLCLRQDSSKVVQHYQTDQDEKVPLAPSLVAADGAAPERIALARDASYGQAAIRSSTILSAIDLGVGCSSLDSIRPCSLRRLIISLTPLKQDRSSILVHLLVLTTV